MVELQRTSQVASRLVAMALKPWGLSESQFNVLRILRGCGPEGLPGTRIAERMVRHDPDLTRLLDRLEKGGMVEKTRDTRDRRVVNARITAEGLVVIERCSEAVRRSIVEALRHLGERRLASLADLLELARRAAAPDGEVPGTAGASTPPERRPVPGSDRQGRAAGRPRARRPGAAGPTTARRRP